MLKQLPSPGGVLSILFSILAGMAFGQLTAGERLQEAIRHYQEGRFERSCTLLLEVIPALRKEASQADLADALNTLSQASIALGRYSESIRAAEEAARLRSATGDAAGEASSLNNLGLAYLYLGDYPQAIGFYEQALVIDRQLGDLEGEVLRLNNIANVHFYEGAYASAFGLYLQALEILKKGGNQEWVPHERFRTLANLGALYQKLGQNERALGLYQELLADPTNSGGSEEARLLTNIGVLYRHLGDPIASLEYYDRARTLFARWRHSAGELGVLRNIGILQAMNLGNLPQARNTFAEVIRLAENTGATRTSLQGRLYRGEAERRLGDLEAAGTDFQEALQIARRIGGVEEEWKALYGLGRISASRNQPQEAERSFSSGLELIESLRSRLAISSLRPGFLADKRDVFGALIDLLMERVPENGVRAGPSLESARVAEVFELMERGRSRSFQDLLGDSLEAAQGLRDPETVSRIRAMRARLSMLAKEMGNAAGDARLEMLSRYNSAEAEYARAEEELRQSSPLKSQSLPGLPAVQQALSSLNVDLLVEFWIGEDTLAWVWATSEGAGAGKVPFRDQDPATACLSAIARPEEAGWKSSCGQLSELVFGHLDGELLESIRTLAVVPDGILEMVPFEALSLPDGDLAGSRLAIQYLPTAAILTARDDSVPLIRMPWSTSIMAIGNPQADNAGGGASLESWPPLPFAVKEIEGISEVLTGRKSIYIGPDALKARLSGLADDPSPILHLATHAVIDPDNPDRSRVVFSGNPEAGPFDYLFLREVPNIDLSKVHLITLSACDTSRGKTIIGEGVQNFSRTFLLAGAQVTVTTLWKVSDQASAEFMKQFYFHLGQGRPVADALRRARQTLIESDSIYSHPFYWAPFIATGQASLPVPLPMTWGSAYLPVLALIVLAFTLIEIVRRRRRLADSRRRG